MVTGYNEPAWCHEPARLCHKDCLGAPLRGSTTTHFALTSKKGSDKVLGSGERVLRMGA